MLSDISQETAAHLLGEFQKIKSIMQVRYPGPNNNQLVMELAYACENLIRVRGGLPRTDAIDLDDTGIKQLSQEKWVSEYSKRIGPLREQINVPGMFFRRERKEKAAGLASLLDAMGSLATADQAIKVDGLIAKTGSELGL